MPELANAVAPAVAPLMEGPAERLMNELDRWQIGASYDADAGKVTLWIDCAGAETLRLALRDIRRSRVAK